MITEKMLEFQILTEILGMVSGIPADRFEFEDNIYNKAAMEDRQRALLKEFLEPYMMAQGVEVVDIAEKSE